MVQHEPTPADPDALADVRVYAIGLHTRFRGITVREGLVFRGPAGWGEFCPFVEYDDREAAVWLAAALEQATVGHPAPVRDRVPVNCIVPVVDPDHAARMVTESQCSTAKVKVADSDDALAADLDRVAAVRDALGPDGAVRIDVNGRWDVDTAVARIREFDRVAGGLEYVEQPCATVAELAAVRRRVDVRIAADESIRRAADPERVPVAEAADVAILKCTPLGGVRRALQVAEAIGLPCVVSSALETSIGLTAELALAAALPDLQFACGLGTLALLDGDLTGPGAALRPVDGYLRVPAAPPTPDPESLRAHEHPDPARVAWWRDRLCRALAQPATLPDSR